LSAVGPVLLIFVDGVGIGPADPEINPFLNAELPALRSILGGEIPTLRTPAVAGSRARTIPLDARLGVDGIPQSGTGQTALLTGSNAPNLFGRHFGPWVPVRLRSLLRERNVLVRAINAGCRVAFANAYPHGYLDRRPRRVAAPPLAAEAAGLLVRHARHLARGRAIASEIVNHGWREHLGHRELPVISAVQAGANLAGIAGDNDLTLFAHYATDHAGHRGGRAGAIRALERLDAFLGGLLDHLSDEILVVLASDHGNIEDLTRGHTLNPALGLVIGHGHEGWSDLSELTSVTPRISAYLGLEPAAGQPPWSA
jgi:2,3-bisphosphoglycerate-independent phosphoglycerate mutase